MTGERTGWRDADLSARHRLWGANCPAADLDFVMMEYNLGVAAAIVEYKHHWARPVDVRGPTYRGLCGLADPSLVGWTGGKPIPFIIAYYWPETWSFLVVPVNDAARAVYSCPRACRLSERRFVKSLYYLRHLAVEKHVLARLSAIDLPAGALLPVVHGLP